MWRETEVDISRDKADFRNLSEAEQHIFTSNLKRQILLDTEQGRSPALALLPIASLPEMENWIVTWTFFETIHSRAYTHIIRNVYSDPSEVLDGVLDIQEILECKRDISRYYDELIQYNTMASFDGALTVYNKYNHKRALWLCLMAIAALEGVRFYASFACSWADRKSTRLNSSHVKISYAVFCWKKK